MKNIFLYSVKEMAKANYHIESVFLKILFMLYSSSIDGLHIDISVDINLIQVNEHY